MKGISGITSRITGVIVGIVAAVIFVVVGITLGPTVVTYFSYINSTSLSGVTMAAILILLAGYAPFFYYLGVIGGAIALLVASVKYSK